MSNSIIQYLGVAFLLLNPSIAEALNLFICPILVLPFTSLLLELETYTNSST